MLGDVERSNHSVKEGDIGQIADISDDAARAYNRQLEGELGEQEWRKLKQVDVAIEKIAEGEYGICSQCENTIPEARLQIVPYAEFCTQCLSKMEENTKDVNNIDDNPFMEN